ncbi:hypothetical protein P691DRAFT_551919 [Macrolepiota fuliginosa MF-IS2]|uniref:Uncharacterized protein n=1 Tax=Macrolepiota fuliginosa MF-IS2 TaxID=1400762 RepID=A0A9P5X2C9_9AGAR|nr:hypothetical protein P691DRAFT_551919 [Macrolepiota fuliginosa MF-IS2]
MRSLTAQRTIHTSSDHIRANRCPIPSSVTQRWHNPIGEKSSEKYLTEYSDSSPYSSGTINPETYLKCANPGIVNADLHVVKGFGSLVIYRPIANRPMETPLSLVTFKLFRNLPQRAYTSIALALQVQDQTHHTLLFPMKKCIRRNMPDYTSTLKCIEKPRK